MITLENNFLKIKINSLGAELKSVLYIRTDTEFMWQANPDVWARTAPVLFPVVGKVKDNLLHIQGKTYAMSQHGFARDKEFKLVRHTNHEAVFLLKNDEQSSAVYPFPFELQITYQLNANALTVNWNVRNTGEAEMYFGIGAHPGFNLSDGMENYELHFEKNETASRVVLQNGLLSDETTALLNNQNALPLHKSLFDTDAIVLKNIQSESITLKHKTNDYAVEMRWKDFPFLGIWSAKNCNDFVCLEPWCGIADTINGHEDISTKTGMNKLGAGGSLERSYEMTFYR